MKYRVLFQRTPMWPVGAREADAIALRADGGNLPANQRYPGDCAGRVISVLPMERDFHAGDLREGSREVIVMTLTEKDRVALAGRTSKLVGGMIVPVTFDDRWGAVAVQMAERHVDPEAFEREEAEAVEAADAANRAEEERYELETAVHQAELDEYARDIARGREPEEPSDAPSSPTHVERRDLFQEQAVALRRALPKTVVHSGAGLYEVGPAKTYATIQSALDQLWADQGSAAFTANQYIRIFADAYTENLVPNASLNPDETNGRTLIIEGDPADDRANITNTIGTETRLFYASCDHLVIRHLSFSSGTSYNIQTTSGCYFITVSDCILTMTTNTYGIYASVTRGVVEDCIFNTVATVRECVYWYRGGNGIVRRCQFNYTGGTKGDAAIRFERAAGEVSGCKFDTFTTAIEQDGDRYTYPLRVANNTAYACTNGIYLIGALDIPVDMINNIFHSCTYVYRVGPWPDEGAAVLGQRITQRNNFFYNNTNFAFNGGTTKTLTEWSAFVNVDASDDIEGTDPQLTNPGAGDFSLHADSPCRNTGHGSGVVGDYLGTAFDANEPDIGAWSSGTLPAASTPTTPTNLTVVDAEDGDKLVASATVDAGDTLRFYYRKVSSTGWLGYVERSDSGSKDITGLDVNTEHVVVAVAKDGVYFSAPTDPVREWVTTGTSATFNMVRSALDQALNAFQATHVAWPNTEYAPTSGTPYLRPTFMPGEPEQADLGDGGQNRLVGVYQVSVFHPTGTGAGAAETKAEEVITAFKRGNVFTTGGVTVRVEKSWRGPAIQEKDWYHVPVTVRWFAYTAN